jgi:hypothetical protein
MDPAILLSYPLIVVVDGDEMARKNSNRRRWTKTELRELKSLARAKTPAGKIARSLKRTEGATTGAWTPALVTAGLSGFSDYHDRPHVPERERIFWKFNHEVFGATMEHGLPLSTGFESFHGWIATLPKRGIDPLHDDVVDFAALVKGRFAQSLMDNFGQIHTLWKAIGLCSSGP